MKYRGVAWNGTSVDLGAPVSVRINCSLDAPADDFTGVFPASANWLELAEIQVSNGEQTVFNGIVDEQTLVCGTNGTLITLRARSRAALLLDNEALPQTYYLPSLSDIFNRHAAPYGFTGFSGDTRTFPVRYEVEKGVSEWSVIETFCRRFLKVRPRITAEGLLLAGVQAGAKPVLFSRGGGIPYTSLTGTVRRCDPVSEVLVRTDIKSGYNLQVTDGEARGRGIRRRRFLDLAGGASADAQSIITDAKRRYREWRLACPGFLTVQVGSSAELRDDISGNAPSLWVTETQYSLSSGGEFTTVILRDNNQ